MSAVKVKKIANYAQTQSDQQYADGNTTSTDDRNVNRLSNQGSGKRIAAVRPVFNQKLLVGLNKPCSQM